MELIFREGPNRDYVLTPTITQHIGEVVSKIYVLPQATQVSFKPIGLNLDACVLPSPAVCLLDGVGVLQDEVRLEATVRGALHVQMRRIRSMKVIFTVDPALNK